MRAHGANEWKTSDRLIVTTPLAPGMTPGPAQHTLECTTTWPQRENGANGNCFFRSARHNIIRVVSVCDGAQNAFVCEVKKNCVVAYLPFRPIDDLVHLVHYVLVAFIISQKNRTMGCWTSHQNWRRPLSHSLTRLALMTQTQPTNDGTLCQVGVFRLNT